MKHSVRAAALVAFVLISSDASAQCAYSAETWAGFPCGSWNSSHRITGLSHAGGWCGWRWKCGTSLSTYQPVYCPPGGQPQLLPMTPNVSSHGAMTQAVNSSGVVVGWSWDLPGDDNAVACIWWPDGSVEIIVPPDPDAESVAYDINDSGVIVGGTMGLPFVYADKEMTLIPDPGLGLGSGRARRISNAGHVVGTFGAENSNARAFLWTGGPVTIMEPINGHAVSIAADVNSSGLVVGASRTHVPSQGYLSSPTTWLDGVASPLSLLPGYLEGGAVSVNDAGVIVGWCEDTEGTLPSKWVVWLDGTPYGLEDLVQNSVPVGTVRHINDAGQIASESARVFTPIPVSIADFDGDCVVDADDLGQLLSSWSNPAIDERFDLDGDGVVGGSDLGILLGDWTLPK